MVVTLTLASLVIVMATILSLSQKRKERENITMIPSTHPFPSPRRGSRTELPREWEGMWSMPPPFLSQKKVRAIVGSLVMAMAATPSLPQKRKGGIAPKKRRVVVMVMTTTLSLPGEE